MSVVAALQPVVEVILLRKLEWYRDGGSLSDRQWSDVLGVLRLQGPQLDRADLERWARVVGVEELLARAASEVGPAV